MIFFLLRECITPEPKNQSPGLTIFLPVPIIVRQLINTENRRRHDTFFGAALGPDAAGRGHPAVRHGPHRAGAEHPFHSGAAGGHGDGVHRRRHGGPHRRRGHRRHRHRQLEHLAAPRHPCGTVHRVFDPNRPVPRGRPPAGRPGRAAAVHALQPHPGSGRCGFRRRHQPLPARVAGGGHLAPGQFQRLLRHLVGGPSLHDGHGNVHSHAPRHRRRPDAQPDQRAGLCAGRGVQLLPHQPHPADPALRPERHSLGCRPRSPGCGAWHSVFHDHRRSSGAGRPAAAGRPALHPKARQLAHHLRLPAQSLAGGYTAGR